MKRHFTITAGTELPTAAGYMIIKGFNDAGLVYAEEFTIDEEGNEGNPQERRLTTSEIAHELKAIDGLNHTVTIEY